MIPLWYAVCLMLGTGLAGYLCSQLWPIVSAMHLTRLRIRSTRMVAELRRLTGALAPARHLLTPLEEDRWALPVSERLTDRPRIEAAKAAALDGQDLPTQHGTLHENARRQELVRHAAPVPDIDWYRGEHRLFSWGWVVEVVARLASVGRTFVWRPEEHPLTPPRHAAWNYDTRALEQFVAEASAEEETARQRRIDREYEALTLSMVARRVVLR